MTRLASKPAYCCKCYGQPEGRYVDFEAAYDGPVLDGESHKVAIDDLILCENCLAEAFTLLDPQGLKETISELTTLLKDAQAELDAKDKMIQGFRASTNELIDHPIAKFPGRPKLEGVPEDVREELRKNVFKRRGTTPDPTQKKKAKAAA